IGRRNHDRDEAVSGLIQIQFTGPSCEAKSLPMCQIGFTNLIYILHYSLTRVINAYIERKFYFLSGF
ncbi:MAG: hypothetical protein ACWA5R_11730, partial [bacterium]